MIKIRVKNRMLKNGLLSTPSLGLTVCLIAACLIATLPGCGKALPTDFKLRTALPLPPIDITGADGSVIHGRGIYTLQSEQQTAMLKLFNQIFPLAYATSGSTSVTYTNAVSTDFTIDVSSFVPGSFTGTTLSLGSVGLGSLSDNNLNVCGNTHSTKCTQASIRVYTTGTLAGFVNTGDSFGAPVYTGTLNPTSVVGLNSAGSVQVQTLTIPTTKHKLKLSDFPNPTYSVTSDFTDAGSGSYQMVYVVEYALLP